MTESGRGGAGGRGGTGGTGGRGGAPARPGHPATVGEPGEVGQRGAKGDPGERGPRGRSFLSSGFLRMAAFLTLLVAATVSGYAGFHANETTKQALNDFLAESEVRRDQACTADEREHARNVENLRNTYRALESPTVREEIGPGLVRLAVAQLSQSEALARNDQAPDYCDAPGVGLPEPDPIPPKRRDFSHLLAPSPPP